MDICEISPEALAKLLEIKQLAHTEGIDALNAGFTGSSDEFDGVHDVCATAVQGAGEGVKPSEELKDLFTDLVGLLIDEKIDGFWNGDGGRGSVDLCWGTSTLNLTFAYYEVDTSYYHYTVTAVEDEKLKALFDANTPEKLDDSNKVVNLSIEGYGDEGCTESMDHGAEPFEEWCNDYLDEHLPGFENGDGGGGRFTIDFETRTVMAELFSHEGSEADESGYPFDITNLAQPA